MPYKVFPDKDGFRVWKIDEQGNKVGKPLSNKPIPKDKADAQARALYASEKKPASKEIEEPIEKELKNGGEWEPEPLKVEIVEEEKKHTEATSFAELMAQYEAEELAAVMKNLTGNFSMLACNIMDSDDIPDKASRLKNLATEYQTLMDTYVKHEATEETPGEEIEDHLGEAEDDGEEDKELSLFGKFKTWLTKAKLGGDDADKKAELQAKARKMLEASKRELPTLTVWKEGNTYRWITAYSNNQRDNDVPAEIITSDSHKEFDQALDNKEWPMPEAWLWHIPYPVGVAQYHAYDESTGYPVAAGVFNKGMEWAAEGLMKANWTGVSHGMPDQWIKRDKEDSSLIIRHRTKEISFLPNWAAANKGTFSLISKECNMADIEKGLPAHKRPEFVAAFGEERVKSIEETLQNKATEAKEAGIETKEKETGPTMADVVKALEFLTGKITVLEQRMATKEVEEVEPFDLVARLKSLSAVGQDTTKVDGRSALARSGPEEPKNEQGQEIAGLTVPLVDKLFQANQAYYGKNGGVR